jgi:hypothetical protein
MTDFEEIMEAIESVLGLLAGEIVERVVKRNMRPSRGAWVETWVSDLLLLCQPHRSGRCVADRAG